MRTCEWRGVGSTGRVARDPRNGVAQRGPKASGALESGEENGTAKVAGRVRRRAGACGEEPEGPVDRSAFARGPGRVGKAAERGI